MKRMLFSVLFVIFVVVLSFGVPINNAKNPYELVLNYEAGFTSVIFHNIQFGEEGTKFDYVSDGGQDVLFPFGRYTLVVTGGRHSVYLLYQPLTVQTRTLLEDNLVVDDTVFPAGTGIIANYGFPFYRVSYTYDILRKGNSFLAIGASLQLRNANIYFEAVDGSELYVNRDLGPVPILKLKGEWWFDGKAYAGMDIDGFYASSRFII